MRKKKEKWHINRDRKKSNQSENRKCKKQEGSKMTIGEKLESKA